MTDKEASASGPAADSVTGASVPDIVEHHLFKIRIELSPAIDSRGLRNILADGRYERTEGIALLAALDDAPPARILELGGGIGLISSLLCTKRAVKSCDVVEANPALIPIIRRTQALNGVTAAKVHNYVVTSDPVSIERGWSRFHVARDFQASSVRKLDEAKVVDRIRVPVASLESLIEKTRADTLIIDIEGAETALLKDVGALPGVKLILMELHPKITGLSGVDTVFANLARLSFVYDADHSSGRVVAFRHHKRAATL